MNEYDALAAGIATFGEDGRIVPIPTDPTPRRKPISFKTSGQFAASYVQPDYLVEGIFQRRYFYSLTGATGAGKTAITTRLAMSVALRDPLGSIEVEQGRVLYLAGENPDDVKARWIAMCELRGVDPVEVAVDFIEGTFNISQQMPVLCAKSTEVGGYALVVVDTSAAYFTGKDENSNTELGNYARDVLRPLTTLHGGPCVIVNAHPVKNASNDNLLPRGGGAFLAEMDGNATAVCNGTVSEMHWQGKFRGPDFTPLHFDLRSVSLASMTDSKGRIHPTVVANVISENERGAREQVALDSGNQILKLLTDGKSRKQADIAKSLGWMSFEGKPNRPKVSRAMKDLEKDKLVAKGRGDLWRLTEKGKKELGE